MTHRLHSFTEGDLVYAYFLNGRFMRGTYNKLKLKKTGPCNILKRISNNINVLEFLEELNISSTFNVVDLYKYEEGSTNRGEPTID